MIPFYLDIETIPSQDPAVRDQLAAEISPPGSMSKPETIAKWEAETKPGLIEAALRKTSFDGALGQCCVIGFARGDDSIDAFDSSEVGERTMLIDAYEAMEAMLKEQEEHVVQIVGHNVVEFDLRFLYHRSVILGVKMPHWLPVAARAWDDKVFDTMFRWGGTRTMPSLDKLCRSLGIGTKGIEIGEDMDGSRVWELWQAKRFEDVVTYCKGDVQRVREIHKMMTAVR